MLDAGYWILDNSYWISDIGYWISDIGYWILRSVDITTFHLAKK